MSATAHYPLIRKTRNGWGKGHHNEKEREQETSQHGNLHAWDFGHKNNSFPSSSLSLLIFCFLNLFPLLHSLKSGNSRKFDVNWATQPPENHLTGRLARVGTAQGWIHGPVCPHPLLLLARVPSCEQASAAPGPGLAPRFCREQRGLARHSFLWSTASTIIRLRIQAGKERRSCHTGSIQWSIEPALSFWKQLLTGASKELQRAAMQLSAHRGGFPIPGSSGLACALQCGSLTSSLKEKMSQKISPLRGIKAREKEYFLLSSVSNPQRRCHHRICLYYFSVWTSDSSPEVHDSILAKRMSLLFLEINDTAIKICNRK